jgi:hypothetical protein
VSVKSCSHSNTAHPISDYKASRYKSEALRLWPQSCNTAKPTRCYNSFPQVQLQDMQLW